MRREQVGGPGEGGMGEPGAGGNWQAIAKATSCQDNAGGHRCPRANSNPHADSLSMPVGQSLQ